MKSFCFNAIPPELTLTKIFETDSSSADDLILKTGNVKFCKLYNAVILFDTICISSFVNSSPFDSRNCFKLLM